MTMNSLLAKLLLGGLLMALCIIVHSVGLTYVFKFMKRKKALHWSFWRSVRILIAVASWIIFLHLINIVLWGSLFAWVKAIPDLQSAIYFSAVTYTTTGYGDVLLPKPWQLIGGIEALTGLLMYGWTTGFFFAIVSRMYVWPDDQQQPSSSNNNANQSGAR